MPLKSEAASWEYVTPSKQGTHTNLCRAGKYCMLLRLALAAHRLCFSSSSHRLQVEMTLLVFFSFLESKQTLHLIFTPRTPRLLFLIIAYILG